MAYARFGDGGEIYLYKSSRSWVCCMCRLLPEDETGLRGDATLSTLASVWKHLHDHTRAGHVVHERTMIRVRRELEEQRSPIQEFTEEVFESTQQH